eukprot:2460661-Rhodomonas_salina.1
MTTGCCTGWRSSTWSGTTPRGTERPWYTLFPICYGAFVPRLAVGSLGSLSAYVACVCRGDPGRGATQVVPDARGLVHAAAGVGDDAAARVPGTPLEEGAGQKPPRAAANCRGRRPLLLLLFRSGVCCRCVCLSLTAEASSSRSLSRCLAVSLSRCLSLTAEMRLVVCRRGCLLLMAEVCAEYPSLAGCLCCFG